MRREDRIAMQQSGQAKIAHSCPFCGGPVELENEEIIAPCGNCGSMLRLLPSQGMEMFMVDGSLSRREAVFFLDRALKEQGETLIRERGEIYQIYLPFFRAVGKVFNYNKKILEHKRCNDEGQEYIYTTEEQESGIKGREMSFAAFDSSTYGVDSLGIRTSVLRLAPLTPAKVKQRKFLSTKYDINYALERYEKSTSSLSALSMESALKRFSKALCPQISMVYMPVWIINFANDSGHKYAIVDCLAKRVLRIFDGQMLEQDQDADDSVEGTVFRLVAHRCEYCGYDLPHQKSGEVFACGNCGRLYRAEGSGYKSVNFNLPKGDFSKTNLFPFWMFRLNNGTDTINLKKSLWIDSDTIFIPAFEITNLKRAARLSLSLSRSIDEIDFDMPDQSDYNFMPASVDSLDAERLILPLLVAGKDNLEHLDLSSLWKLYPGYDESRLVWLPFVEEGYFYRGLLTGQGFEKAALAV